MIRGVPHEHVLDLKQPYFSKSPIHNFSVFASQLCKYTFSQSEVSRCLNIVI